MSARFPWRIAVIYWISSFPVAVAQIRGPVEGLALKRLEISGPAETFTPNATLPDTDGAAGETQYGQWVNGSFAVFDKAGTMRAETTTISGTSSQLPTLNRGGAFKGAK
jgi:hypothetical protein